FQAEDGIRDFHVTGVQTCALPISALAVWRHQVRSGAGGTGPHEEYGYMSKKILVLPGDGIGPEIVAEAVKVLQLVGEKYELSLELSYDDLGGAAYDRYGTTLAGETLERARQADAVLLGAVGGPKWDTIDPALRPERGLLKIRSQLGLFANLRPALLYPQLAEASTLKPEVVAGLDILIVRELTGGIY